MSVLGGDVDKAKLAAFILLTSPGTPYIYYGEEIGMTGRKPDENIRRPMQWSAGANGGFSSADPWEALDPAHTGVNVADQQGAPDSLLTTYQNLIALRSSRPIFSTGAYIPVKASGSGVYAFIRKDDLETLLIVVNLSKAAISDFTLEAENVGLNNGTYAVSDIIAGTTAADLTIENASFTAYQPLAELSDSTGYIFEIVKR